MLPNSCAVLFYNNVWTNTIPPSKENKHFFTLPATKYQKFCCKRSGSWVSMVTKLRTGKQENRRTGPRFVGPWGVAVLVLCVSTLRSVRLSISILIHIVTNITHLIRRLYCVHSFVSLLSLLWRYKSRLMKSLCCLCVSLSLSTFECLN
jgi:hypothetical protein